MEKKIYCIEARLVQGSTWYIEGKDQAGKRIRTTFGINRIKNKTSRLKKANEIIAELLCPEEKELPKKIIFTPIQYKENPTIFEALTLAFQVKSDSDRKNTVKSYRTMYNKLALFLREKELANLPVTDFKYAHALSYMAYIGEKKRLSNNTYNNYLKFSREFWQEMIRQEFITLNPFSKIKKKRTTDKIRMNFTEAERKVIISYIQEKNYWLYIACLFQYYCFIRPSELLRLKFENIDMIRGVINLKGQQTKNWKDATITIPDYLLSVLKHPDFLSYHRSWFVFGRGLKPHSTVPAKDDKMNKLHSKYIHELKEQGKLQDIRGFTLYSWKDTGCTDAAEFLTPFELRDQLRHSTMEMVMKYYHKKTVIQAVKKHPVQL